MAKNVDEAVVVEHPQFLEGGAGEGMLGVARMNEDAAFAGNRQNVVRQAGQPKAAAHGGGEGSVRAGQ